MYKENEIYKIVPNEPVTETQRGRKPSAFRSKVDKTLGSMATPNFRMCLAAMLACLEIKLESNLQPKNTSMV